MPAKSKKASLNSEPEKKTAKFVVEEKTEEEPVKVTDDIKISEVPETAASTVNLNEPVKEIEEAKEPSITVSQDKPQKETGLKSESETDTLPSSNLTSFSLLDPDKKDVQEEKSMLESINTLPTEETVAPPAVDVTAEKSSQEEVNKWIKNYDDKEVTEKKKGPGFFKVFLIILTILSLVAVIAGGIYYYQKNIAGNDNNEVTNEAAPTVADVSPSPVPTETPASEESKVDYTKYTLQILNGSGIPGEAGKAKDLLNDLDFKSVVTANADNYDYKDTVVSLKDGVSDQVFAEVKKLLGSTYTLESKAESASTSSKYDVIVTVGTRK